MAEYYSQSLTVVKNYVRNDEEDKGHEGPVLCCAISTDTEKIYSGGGGDHAGRRPEPAARKSPK